MSKSAFGRKGLFCLIPARVWAGRAKAWTTSGVGVEGRKLRAHILNHKYKQRTNWPHLLNLPKLFHQLGTNCSNARVYGGHLIRAITVTIAILHDCHIQFCHGQHLPS